MTTRLRKNASSICVIILVLVLFLILIFIWTGISNNVFSQNKSTQKVHSNENRMRIENRINFEPKFFTTTPPTPSTGTFNVTPTYTNSPPQTVGGSWNKGKEYLIAI